MNSLREKAKSVGKLILGIFFILLITLVFGGIAVSISEMIPIPFVAEAGQFIGFILGSLAVMNLFNITLDYHTLTKSELKLGFLALLGSFGIALLLSALVSLFNITPPQNAVSETLNTGSPVIIFGFILLNFFFVGPAEELVFRGYIQRQIRESFTLWGSIVGSAILFGFAHIPAIMSGEFISMASYFVVLILLGGLLGYIYERTQNIMVPIIVHACYNSISALPYLFG